MKEDFLYYIWQNLKFDFTNLRTHCGKEIQIISPGKRNLNSGPDFFNALIEIDNQKWAGNIEIHVNSSDWYLHQHQTDNNYNSVILHVVWQHDVNVYRANQTSIPVLELKNLVRENVLSQYLSLFQPKKWIYCEQQIKQVPKTTINSFLNQLYLERLNNKTKQIDSLLTETKNDWEATLFINLAKGFGLNTNGDAFFKIAQKIGFTTFRKESFTLIHLEALLFGCAGLLEIKHQEQYPKELHKHWEYLKHKYQINDIIIPVEFFKHRPDNFPTIRLAQFAQLYHLHQNLFEKLLNANSTLDYYTILSISTSEYWKTHYNFDKESPLKIKKTTPTFIDLLLINTIIPVLYAYKKKRKEDIKPIITLTKSIASEKNSIIDRFRQLGLKCNDALQSQSLLQLKKNFCDKSGCIKCKIGLKILTDYSTDSDSAFFQ